MPIDGLDATTTMRTIYQLLLAVMLFSMAAASHAQTLTPTSVTLKPSQTQQFSIGAASKTLYTWSIDPSSGTISASGLYKAPATITAITTVTVYAFEPGHQSIDSDGGYRRNSRW